MARANSKEVTGSKAYATPDDFEQIFTEDMRSLYLLALLLVGDPDKAEQCFVAGLGESVKGNTVFKEWARSWVRRTIIQSAIRLVGPRQHSETATGNLAAAQPLDKLPLVSQAEVSAIIELAPLDRFVFILSALERYSDHDCSILLGCARREVVAARARASQQLGRLMILRKNRSEAGSEDPTSHGSPGSVIELTIARYFPMPAGNSNLSYDAPMYH